jgi:plasmid replication initiation protein
LKLPSTYSIRIYELLKQYEKIGKRKFDLQELKEIVGAVEQIEVKGKKVEKDNYPLYGNFRQKVLLKAERDLENYTDIRFEFEALKKGRKVKEIMFYIFPNVPKKKEKQGRRGAKKVAIVASTPSIKNPVAAELFPLVQEWVSPKLFEKWLNDYPESQVRKAITYTLNRLKKGEHIENVGGYLFAMVKQTNLFDPVVIKEEKKTQKREKQEMILAKKVSLEQELKSLRQELLNKETAIIDALFLEQPELESEIFEKTKKNRFSQYNSTKNKTENLADSLFAGAFRNTVRKQFPKRFAAIDSQYKQKIKLVKQALQIL